jgi:probable F420-dependent oxidoreductase
MKVGINIRNWGPHATPENLSACAQIADRSTLNSIWLNDHIGFPPPGWNNEFGLSDDMGAILDPLSVLTYLAGVTQRISLGTGVLIIPYRPKLLTAKWLATIQVLSNERMMMGIGPGWMAEEFTALGVDRSKRGKITDETLEFLHRAFDNESVVENGQELILKPRPKRPPFLIGGAPHIAIPRALRVGDGWIPVGILPEELKPLVESSTQQAADLGRPPLETVVMKTLPLEKPAQAIEMATAYRNAGATHFVHTQDYSDASDYQKIVDQMTGVIQPAVT